MKDLLIGGWTEIKKLWSVWIGVVGAALMAGLPALDAQWPTLAPSLIAFFPKNGQQWVPVAGAVVAIVARVLSQSAVIDLIKKAFGKGESNG